MTICKGSPATKNIHVGKEKKSSNVKNNKVNDQARTDQKVESGKTKFVSGKLFKVNHAITRQNR